MLKWKYDDSVIQSFDDHTNKSKPMYVLREKYKCYKTNFNSRFSNIHHSRKNMDGDKFLNKMIAKLKNKVEFTRGINKYDLMRLCNLDT